MAGSDHSVRPPNPAPPLSHELRTPLHGILSYSQIGVFETPGANREELLDYFKRITECGKTLLTLVDELLDLVKYAWASLCAERSS